MLIRKQVLAYYLAISVVSLIAYVVPTLSAFLSLLTLGLFALIPNIWLYLTLLLPVVLFRSNSEAFLLLKAASIALTLYVGIGVPKQRNDKIDSAIAGLTKDDFNRPTTVQPTHLKFLVSSYYSSDDKKNALKTSACDTICQRLLINGEVETVTLEARDNRSQQNVSTVTFKMERLARCPDAFATNDEAIVDTILQAIEGNCIVAIIGQDMTNGVQFESKWIDLDKNIFPEDSYVPRAVRYLVSEKLGDSLVPIAQVTSVRYRKADDVLMASPYGSFFTTVSGWHASGTPTTKNEFDFPTYIENKLKISALPPMASTGVRQVDMTAFNRIHLDTATVEKTLDDQSDATFNQDVTMAITSWAEYLWYKTKGRELTPEET